MVARSVSGGIASDVATFVDPSNNSFRVVFGPVFEQNRPQPKDHR